MWITSSENYFCVCLDFEFVTCPSGRRHVWEIGACVLSCPHINFQSFVVPPMQVLPNCVTNENLSVDWLRNNGAVSLSNALHDFIAWLIAHCTKDRILFCAHGAFSADQPLLCEALARTGLFIPRPHFFLDTLQYVRHAFRADHLDKFTLAFLVENFLNDTVQHKALSDATHLVRLLLIAQQRVPLSGYIVATHCVALTLVPGIGPGFIQDLIRSGVPDTVEDLALYFAHGNFLPPFVSEIKSNALKSFVRTVCEQSFAFQLPSSTACAGGTSTTCSENANTPKLKPT